MYTTYTMTTIQDNEPCKTANIQEYKSKYWLANKVDLSVKKLAYRNKNREKINAQQREYYKKNKEAVKLTQKKHHDANKETINAKKRIYRQIPEVKVRIAANRKKLRDDKKAKHKAEVLAAKYEGISPEEASILEKYSATYVSAPTGGELEMDLS